MSLLKMSGSAAVMIFMIIVIRALTINRLPKRTFIALWGITLARLLTPFILSSPFSVYSLINRVAAELIPAGAEAADGLPVNPAGASQVANLLPVVPAGAAASDAAIMPTAIPAGALPWIWGIGFSLCVMYFTIAYLICRRRFKASRRVENAFILQWLSEHGLRRPVTIRQSSGIQAPLTYGILHPVILMPSGTDWSDTKEIRYVLAHEYVHIRRFDGVTKFLLTISLCIHWFNPLVWVMYILANRDIELSCDEKVVRLFGETIKSEYALALIEMEERKSGLTLLCSHFSKNAIEERIEAIMKMKRITVCSLAAACGIVMIMASTFATSAAVSTSNDRKNGETNQTEAAAPYSYSFRPAPEIYFPYSAYGITISEDGEKLLYNGQRVRLFVDEHSDEEAFFLDEADGLDLSVIRDASGNITQIERISDGKAQEYRTAFFADDTNPNVEVNETAQETVQETVQDITGPNKLQQYSAYGVTLSADGKVMYHNGQRVKLLVDILSDGNFMTFWTDEKGTANLSVARDSAGQITAIESISEEKAQEYLSASKQKEQYQYDQDALEELEARTAKRIGEWYPDN